jgi:cytochrome c oxidase cbb3-type subunit 3
MTNFWTYYVITLVAINIIGATWLLWATSKKRSSNDTQSSTETTGHVWDGDLTEYNKPLPRWWIILFYLTIVFAIIYLVYYPSTDKFQGMGNWSSASEHKADKDKADAKLQALYARFEGQGIDLIAKDPIALTTGKQIFANNCATCHGADAGGGKGFPKLSDNIWKFDGSPDGIVTTIQGGVNVPDGRSAIMPPLAAVLGSEQAVTEAAVYVQSLSGMNVDETLARSGEKIFNGVCAACHGVDGKGNPALGASNLTDKDWMYGSTLEDIKYGINNGRAGQMPAHLPLIGETEVRLVAAYVYSLSQSSKP